MWESLIPLGLSLLQNFTSGGKSERNEEFSETKLSPAMEEAARKIMERAESIYGRSFPDYKGQRVAQPTAARSQLDQFMPNLQSSVGTAMGQGSKYGAQIDQMMSRAPIRINVPTLTGNGVRSTQQGGYYDGATGGVPGMGGGGNSWADFDASAFAKAALPQREFNQGWVAFDPAKAVK